MEKYLLIVLHLRESINEYRGYLKEIDIEIGEKRREIAELIRQRKKYQHYVNELKQSIMDAEAVL